MDNGDKIILTAVSAFVLLAWGSAWAFTRVNGYPEQWYWLPIGVTAIVALMAGHAWFNRFTDK